MYAKCGVLVIFLCYLNIGLHLVYGYEQQGRAINSPENRRVRHPGYYIPKVKSAESVLADRQLLHDQHHLKEDFKTVLNDEQLAKMTEAELEFHYFKLHDTDNNNRLDGLEMMAAVSHILHPTHSGGDDSNTLTKDRFNEEMNHFINMIDRMLEDNDRNRDGFIDYQEYALIKNHH